METLAVGSQVKALSESNTWMHQYDVVGTITEIFHVAGKAFAKISVPKWLIKRNHGEYIIRDWERNGLSKKADNSLLLDEGIELAHLELSEMPDQTIDEKVDALIDQAFGCEGERLGINVIYYPKGLAVTPGVCMCESCNEARTHLAWHNCHGTVQAFMVCEAHYGELNGRCSDSFPLKSR